MLKQPRIDFAYDIDFVYNMVYAKKLAPAIIVHLQERHLADKKKDRIYFFHHYLACFRSDRQRISR